MVVANGQFVAEAPVPLSSKGSLEADFQLG